MQKNQHNRQPQQRQKKYPVAVPDVISNDELDTMQDAEVISRLNCLLSDRDKVLAADMDARVWEEEISYYRRQLHIRKTRRDAHDSYIYALEQESANSVPEHSLPSADLDNSRFVRLHGGY